MKRTARGVGIGLGWGPTTVFTLPALVLFGVFILYPLITALSYSFFDWRGVLRGDFVGIANYLTIFTELPYREHLPNAFVHNLMLFGGAMVFQNTIGLVLATLLHRLRFMRQFFQTVYTLPYLVSPLVIGYLWSLTLSPLFLQYRLCTLIDSGRLYLHLSLSLNRFLQRLNLYLLSSKRD